MSDATLVVEIHVPLTPDLNAAEGENPFPWIDDLSDLVSEIEESGEAFVVEEGDEFEGHYVVVITGADERELLGIANRVGNLPGVPTGVFAVVTDDDAEELGQGRREDIS
jgi:thioredoxin reductase